MKMFGCAVTLMWFSPDKNGHNRSLENMKNLITIINSKELENIWSTAKTHSSTSTIQDDSNNIQHEHIGDASKSDVSPLLASEARANVQLK